MFAGYRLQDSHYGSTHRDAAGLAQLSHGVAFLNGDTGLCAALGHRVDDGRIGVTSEIDPLCAALPDRLSGLLHANDLLLRSKLRDHGKFLLIYIARFTVHTRAV